MTIATEKEMSAPIPVRILFLHGYTQNPLVFRAKSAALNKSLQKAFPSPKYALHLSYPAAPHKLALADIPGYNNSDLSSEEVPDAWAWWRRKDYNPTTNQEIQGDSSYDNRPDLPSREVVYEGLEASMSAIADTIRKEGPFDGVIGFSQGGAAAGIVASLLEGRRRKEAFEQQQQRGKQGEEREKKYGEERGGYPASFLDEEGEDGFVQGPLKFAVVYSGFKAPGDRYAALYEPKIETPVLHVLGQVDIVVEEKRGRALVGACEGGDERVLMHPGGHFVPSQKGSLDAVVGFIRSCIEDKRSNGGEKNRGDEERVEDMDMPF